MATQTRGSSNTLQVNSQLSRTTSYGRRTTPLSPRVSVGGAGKPAEVLVTPPKTQEEMQATKEYLQTLRSNVNRSRILAGGSTQTPPQSTAPANANRVPPPRINVRTSIESLGDVEEEVESKAVVKDVNTLSVKQLQDQLQAAQMVSKIQAEELATLKATLKQMETGSARGSKSTNPSESDENTKLKKTVVTLTQRALAAEQTRDNLIQKWNSYEEEKQHTLKALELAEFSFQALNSQNTKLAAEVELYKQGSKESTNTNSRDLASLRKLQEENTILQTKFEELSSELEKEKADKAIIIAELKVKVTTLEATDRSTSITQRLANLPSHPKKEMSDARADIAAKDRKIANLENSLAEIQSKSVLLAEQLNRICDEVEKSEKIVAQMEHVTRENDSLKDDKRSLGAEIHSLKEELVQKENEITTLLDDNDKMVAKLFTLGYQVSVEDDVSLKIVPLNEPKSPPKTPAVAPPTSDNSKKTAPRIAENLVGLSIDELLDF